MKTILVPTDFSQAALDALNYAVAIAPSLEASIKVVHVYSGSLDLNQPFVVRAGMGRLEALQEDLHEFVKSSSHNRSDDTVATKIKIETQIVDGFIEAELIKLSKAPDVAMLVMGTTGASGITGKLFGSISIAISREAYCPVILVPKNITFKGINHIMLASNYESANPILLKKLSALAETFDAVLHFVHVNDASGKEDYDLTEQYILEELFKKDTPRFAFEISTINSKSVIVGLNAYIAKNRVDLMVMAGIAPHFWHDILNPSITKAMAIDTEVPILVYHLDK